MRFILRDLSLSKSKTPTEPKDSGRSPDDEEGGAGVDGAEETEEAEGEGEGEEDGEGEEIAKGRFPTGTFLLKARTASEDEAEAPVRSGDSQQVSLFDDITPAPRHMDADDIPDGAVLLGGEEVDDEDEAEDENGDELAKAGPHKYIRREPTGDAKRKWRYFYHVPGHGVVTSDSIKEGSRYKGTHTHEGKEHEGHFEIVKHDKESGHVTVRHTGSGVETRMHHSELAGHVNKQHEAAHRETKAKKIAEIESATDQLFRTPTVKQADRVKKLVEDAADQGWLTHKEANEFAGKMWEAHRGGHDRDRDIAKQARQNINKLSFDAFKLLQGAVAGKDGIELPAKGGQKLLAKLQDLNLATTKRDGGKTMVVPTKSGRMGMELFSAENAPAENSQGSGKMTSAERARVAAEDRRRSTDEALNSTRKKMLGDAKKWHAKQSEMLAKIGTEIPASDVQLNPHKPGTLANPNQEWREAEWALRDLEKIGAIKKRGAHHYIKLATGEKRLAEHQALELRRIETRKAAPAGDFNPHLADVKPGKNVKVNIATTWEGNEAIEEHDGITTRNRGLAVVFNGVDWTLTHTPSGLSVFRGSKASALAMADHPVTKAVTWDVSRAVLESKLRDEPMQRFHALSQMTTAANGKVPAKDAEIKTPGLMKSVDFADPLAKSGTAPSAVTAQGEPKLTDDEAVLYLRAWIRCRARNWLRSGWDGYLEGGGDGTRGANSAMLPELVMDALQTTRAHSVALHQALRKLEAEGETKAVIEGEINAVVPEGTVPAWANEVPAQPANTGV